MQQAIGTKACSSRSWQMSNWRSLLSSAPNRCRPRLSSDMPCAVRFSACCQSGYGTSGCCKWQMRHDRAGFKRSCCIIAHCCGAKGNEKILYCTRHADNAQPLTSGLASSNHVPFQPLNRTAHRTSLIRAWDARFWRQSSLTEPDKDLL